MKKIYIVLMILCILMISACGMANDESAIGDNVDGISFDYFQTYTVKDTDYEVFLPNNILEALYYEYKEGNVVSNSASWTVNFIYDVNYHVNESKETSEVWSELYLKLKETETTIEELCGFEITTFDPYQEVELEYVLNNSNQQDASYVIYQTYLPLRLVNKSTNRSSTIGVPIKVDVLIKVNGMVKNPFKDEMMLWEDFLAIENLK